MNYTFGSSVTIDGFQWVQWRIYRCSGGGGGGGRVPTPRPDNVWRLKILNMSIIKL